MLSFVFHTACQVYKLDHYSCKSFGLYPLELRKASSDASFKIACVSALICLCVSRSLPRFSGQKLILAPKNSALTVTNVFSSCHWPCHSGYLPLLTFSLEFFFTDVPCPTRPHGFGCLQAFRVRLALHLSHMSLRNPSHKICTRCVFHLFRANAGIIQNGPSQNLWTLKSLKLLQQESQGSRGSSF